MSRLKLNDRVTWRGAWGNEAPKEATVIEIDLCGKDTKYGKSVKSVDWETVRNGVRQIVVTLDNGHWAYGSQLTEIKK